LHGSSTALNIRRVLQAFGWDRPDQVRQHRHTWYVACAEGQFFVKQTRVDPKNFAFIQACLEKIRAKGYANLLPYIHTKTGETLVSKQGECWYATPWKKAKAKPEVEKLVRSLAQFHRIAAQIVQLEKERYSTIDHHWIQQWRKKEEKIRNVKEEVEQKEFPSPFDYSFAKHYDTIRHSLKFAVRGMEKFRRVENGKAPRYTICHNRIHWSNIVADDRQFYWIDFDHATLDSPVRDLALLIQRFSHLQSPHKLLQLYEKEFPLKKKEKRLLAVYLAYPERILKRLHRYRNEIAIASEPTSQKQLEQEMEQLNEIHQLIVDLWPIRN